MEEYTQNQTQGNPGTPNSDTPTRRRKLFSKLSESNLYTGTIEDFESDFKDPELRNRLYTDLNTDKLYTKSKDEFESQFFSDFNTTDQQPDVKKKAGGDVSGTSLSTPGSGNTGNLPDWAAGLQGVSPQSVLQPVEVTAEREQQPLAPFDKDVYLMQERNFSDDNNRYEALTPEFVNQEQAPETNPFKTFFKSLIDVGANQVPANASMGAMAMVPNDTYGMGVMVPKEQQAQYKETLKAARLATYQFAQEKLDESAKVNIIREWKQVKNGNDAANYIFGAVGEATAQIPASVLTSGMSSIFQEVGGSYLEDVTEIASRNNTTPEQVIKSGQDENSLSVLIGGVSGMLDFAGARNVVGVGELKKALRKKALTAVKDFVQKGAFEAGTEATQDATVQFGRGLSAGDNMVEAVQQIDPARIGESALKGFIGGGVLTGAGSGIKASIRSLRSVSKSNTTPETSEISPEVDAPIPESVAPETPIADTPEPASYKAKPDINFDSLEAELQTVQGNINPENITVTNPIYAIPDDINGIFDKIESDAYLSPDEMLAADTWARESKRQILANPNISPEEKKGTLDLLNSFISDIDTENERYQQAALNLEGEQAPQSREEVLANPLPVQQAQPENVLLQPDQIAPPQEAPEAVTADIEPDLFEQPISQEPAVTSAVSNAARPDQIVKIDPVTITANSVNFMVTPLPNGFKVVNPQTGKAFSPGTGNYNAAVAAFKNKANDKSYKNQLIANANNGQRVQLKPGTSPLEYVDAVASESTNPLEIAEAYSQEPAETELSAKEQIIKDNLKPFPESGYRRFGDRNNIKGESQKKLKYFSKYGLPIDVQAQIISETAGMEITEQDIIEFADRYPNGQQTAFNANPTRQKLADRFHQLTGLNLDDKLAEELISKSNQKKAPKPQYRQEVQDFVSANQNATILINGHLASDGTLNEQTLAEELEEIGPDGADLVYDLSETAFNKLKALVTPGADAETGEYFQTVKEYSGHTNRTGRLQPAPLIRPTGAPVPKLSQLLGDLANALNTRLNKAKKMRGGGLGTYNPGNTAIRVKDLNDLDVAAHEISHSIDDAYGVLASLKGQASHSLDTELSKFWDYGSKPPKSLPVQSALNYQRGEGFAEFLRAFIVNPAEARTAAPNLTALYEKKVPENVRNVITRFSNGYREYAGDSAIDKTISNVETLEDLQKSEGKLKERDKVPYYDRLIEKLVDSQHIWRKAYQKATQVRGITGILPEADPRVLADNFMGFTRRFNAIFTHGLVNNRNEFVIDAVTGGKMSFPWLMQPLAGETPSDLVQNEKLLTAFMISQRTIEYEAKFLKDKIALALSQGKIVPDAVFADPQFKDLESLNDALKQALADRITKVDVFRDRSIRAIQQRAQERRDKLTQREITALSELDAIKDKKAADIEFKRISDILRINDSEVSGRVRRTKRSAAAEKAGIKMSYEEKLHAARVELIEEKFAARQKEINSWEASKIELIELEAEKRIKAINRNQPYSRISLNDTQQNLTGIGAGVYRDIEVANQVQAEFEAIRQNDPEKIANIEEAARRYRAYAEQLLRYQVEGGRLAQEDYDRIIADNEFYVALQRLQEEYAGELDYEADQRAGFFGNKSVGTPKEVIRKAKGGTEFILNPYLNLNLLAYSSIRETDRNKIMVVLTDGFTNNRDMHEGEPVDLSEFGYKVPGPEEHSIKIFRDGKAEHYKFNKDVYASLKQIGDMGSVLGLVGKVFEFKANTLRNLITYFPAFQIRNILRDTATRPNISQVGSGFTDLNFNKGIWNNMELYGASQQFDKLNERVDFFDLQKKAIQKLTDNGDVILNPIEIAKRGATWYTDVMGKGENVNRAAEYKAAFREAKKQGMDDYNANLFAAQQARNLLNFAKAGTFIRTFNRFVPFTNARIQGWVRTMEAFKKNPARASANLMLYTVLPTLVLNGINRAALDQEEWEELQSMPWYIKDLFWNFKISDNFWLRIPKPAGLAVLSAIAENSLNSAIDNAPLTETFEGFADTAFSQGLPADLGTGLGVLPPELQIYMNYDTFRKNAIVSPYEAKKDIDLRKGYKHASALAQALQATLGMVNKDAEVDARYIDFYMRSQFGYVGSTAAKLSDIGKEGKTNSDWLATLGIFVQSPSIGAPEVQWVEDRAAKYSFFTNKDTKDDFQSYLEAKSSYYEAKTDSEKDRLARELRKIAKQFRKDYEGTTTEAEVDGETIKLKIN